MMKTRKNMKKRKSKLSVKSKSWNQKNEMGEYYQELN